jgi:hypothetical protein
MIRGERADDSRETPGQSRRGVPRHDGRGEVHRRNHPCDYPPGQERERHDV